MKIGYRKYRLSLSIGTCEVRTSRVASLLLLVCVFNHALIGQSVFGALPNTAVITTERPTVGYSPDLVPAHSLQVENGSNLLFQKSQYVADLPESLVRLGLTDRVEARFLVSNFVYTSSSNSIQTTDSAISAKLLVRGPNSPLPKSAIVSLSFPTGGADLTSGSYDPSLKLIWTQSVRHGYFFNQVAGATLTTLAGARRPVWAPSIAGGRAMSSSLSVFVEYAPTVLQDRSVVNVVDGGFALTRGKFLQLDVRAGWQQDIYGAHTLVSFGYSRRVDNWFGNHHGLRSW